MTIFFHLFRDSGGAMYSWATEVARVCRKRDQTSLQSYKHSFHKDQCWTSLKRIQLTLSEICSTYRATSTQHTENLFIFRLLKTWRWLVNALRPRSWHDFEDIYIRQKLNSCCSGTSVRKQAWFQNTVFSSGITSRRSTETRHSHPQISPNPTYNPGEGTPTYNGQECSL